MDNPDVLNDVRYLRDVVARTEPPRVNYYWPVTLCWGILISLSYLAYFLLGRAGNNAMMQWVWPVGMVVATALNWYLVPKVRANIQKQGVRPRFRKDLMYLWLSITLVGLLWSEGLGILGLINSHWYVLSFLWGSVYFVGYIMNGVLISSEWFWAAGVLLASLIVAFLAGPALYWLPGMWIGGTFLLAGFLGWRNVRRHLAQA
jgi:hypothetical protein